MLTCEFLKPDWYKLSKCHDWKNYVTPEIQSHWCLFTDDQKIMIGHMLRDIADAEEWE